MLVHSGTGMPIDNLMRKGGKNYIYISGKDGTWDGANPLLYTLNVTDANGGTPSVKGKPVIWKRRVMEPGGFTTRQNVGLHDLTKRFNAVMQLS